MKVPSSGAYQRLMTQESSVVGSESEPWKRVSGREDPVVAVSPPKGS